LARKFNFSTDNAGNIIVTKLQVVSLGKNISKYFNKTPTIKFVVGTLDTNEGEMGEMRAKMSDLPNELVRDIFLLLSLEDRKSAVLVCRRFRNVGEDPVLWKFSVIKITCGEDIQKLSHRRILNVQKISVYPFYDWNPQQLEELFQATLELPKLKQIQSLCDMDVRSVNPQLLGKAVSRLEVIILHGVFMATTNDQMREIFSQMAENGLTKKRLTLRNIDFRPLELDSGVLAKAMTRSEKLVIGSVSIRSDQTQKLFESMVENNQLKDVDFSSTHLNTVTKEMFGAALAKMEKVSLRLVAPAIQIRALFEEMSRNSSIKSLALSEASVSMVDPKMLARVLSKLGQVSLNTNILTNEQARELFGELRHNCRLNILDLDDNDLSAVNPDDLAAVVANNNIEELGLDDTRLSSEQITALLTRAQENTKLKRLSLLGNSISQVDPALLERAKQAIVQLDIDSDEELEDYESDEENSLDGFIASESDEEINEEEESENDN